MKRKTNIWEKSSLDCCYTISAHKLVKKNMASKGMSVLVEKRLATASFMCRGSREAIGWSYRDLRGMGSVRCQLGGLMLFVLGKVSQAKGI